MKVSFYKAPSGKQPVEKFIESLPRPDQVRFADVMQSISSYGLGCPRVILKPLEGKLWEIKFRPLQVDYRTIYILPQEQHMVWLHAFKKKTQRTPLKDLYVARVRAKEFL